MSAWHLAWLLMGALACLPSVQAQESEKPYKAAFELLQQAQQAARNTDYAGVFTYTESGTMRSSRIIHVVDGTGERERLEVLDGSPREFIRHNETQLCLVPEKNLVLIDKARTDRFPSLFLGNTDAISEYYELSVSEADITRVAGRECQMIHVEPRSEDRYGYKFCVDTETKLLIKAQTVSDQDVIDEIAFTMLQTGEDVVREGLDSSWDTSDWDKVQISTRDIDVTELGWRIQSPSGFSFSKQLARPMKSGDAVKHVVLSDGLATVSVFIEVFDAANDARTLHKGAMRNGAINVYGTRIGDYWLTAVGIIPTSTLQGIAEQTQYVAPPAGQQ
jgi:sigma-E factor negative regulatory protein RseB|tara:strand:- start:67209 stop:68207 length:999 start_codon:yes stop_codon:yes gene_type:complete